MDGIANQILIRVAAGAAAAQSVRKNYDIDISELKSLELAASHRNRHESPIIKICINRLVVTA